MEHMAKEMKPLIVPQAMLIAEIGDEPVGFVIGVPDINVAIRHVNGRVVRFAHRFDQIAQLQNQNPHRATSRPWSCRKVSARRHRRDARSATDGRGIQARLTR